MYKLGKKLHVFMVYVTTLSGPLTKKCRSVERQVNGNLERRQEEIAVTQERHQPGIYHGRFNKPARSPSQDER